MLDRYNIKLILPNIYYLVSKFFNNRSIIEYTIQLKLFSNKQLGIINIVRLFFKVVFLLDLTIEQLN